MNILMVVHQFLPRHLAGSEVYTYRLAAALRGNGHQVHIFHTEIRPDRPQYELSRREYAGIPCFEAVHNRCFDSFERTYRDPDMERVFEVVLDDVHPEIVHLQHLFLHSIGYIDIARDRGLPILYTLHEYMLMCLNGGMLLRPGSTLCDGPAPDACARCAAIEYPELAAGRSSRLGALGDRMARIAARLRRSRPARERTKAADEGEDGNGYRPAIERRRRDVCAALDRVDLFVAPSAFLRQRFIDDGMIQPERIVRSDYGFLAQPFQNLARARSATLRVGYVGTISEFKGVHLIRDAFGEIDEPGIECRIYGDLTTFPDYTKRLLAGGAPAALRFMGRIENEGVAQVLAGLDVLIVPSIWFENSPLTIHEAYLAGVPVLTSDRGGMAELVEDGKTGLHFRLGDAADLRRQILRVLHEPGLLESLRGQLPKVKTMEQDASETEERYRQLLANRRPVS